MQKSLRWGMLGNNARCGRGSCCTLRQVLEHMHGPQYCSAFVQRVTQLFVVSAFQCGDGRRQCPLHTGSNIRHHHRQSTSCSTGVMRRHEPPSQAVREAANKHRLGDAIVSTEAFGLQAMYGERVWN